MSVQFPAGMPAQLPCWPAAVWRFGGLAVWRRRAWDSADSLVPREFAPRHPPPSAKLRKGAPRPAVRGGGRGIRTHDDVAAIAVFKTAALGHYASPPGMRPLCRTPTPFAARGHQAPTRPPAL